MDLNSSGSSPQSVTSYVSRYVVVKNSWKGRYSRLFCVTPTSLLTADVNTLRITNDWPFRLPYGGQIELQPSPNNQNDFLLIFPKGKNSTKLSFTCSSAAQRSQLLTDVWLARLGVEWPHRGTGRSPQLSRVGGQPVLYKATKTVCRGGVEETLMAILPAGVVQVETLESSSRDTVRILGLYPFTSILGISILTEDNSVLAISTLYNSITHTHRVHLYKLESAAIAKRFATICLETASNKIGISRILTSAAPPLSEMATRASCLGISTEQMAPLARFSLSKLSPRHGHRVERELVLSAGFFVIELDALSLNVTSVHPIRDFAVFVCATYDSQVFQLQLVSGEVRTYNSPAREAIIIALLDLLDSANTAAAGDKTHYLIPVLGTAVPRGLRLAPFYEQPTEAALWGVLQQLSDSEDESCTLFRDRLAVFNANCLPLIDLDTKGKSGRFAGGGRESTVGTAISAICSFASMHISSITNDRSPSTQDTQLIDSLFALTRLLSTGAGHRALFGSGLLNRILRLCSTVLAAPRAGSSFTSSLAVDVACRLVVPHYDGYEERASRELKARVLGDSVFVDSVCSALREEIARGAGAGVAEDKRAITPASLATVSLLRFVAYVICPPYSEDTSETHFSVFSRRFLDAIGPSFFSLLGATPSLQLAAACILCTLCEEVPGALAELQDAALTTCGTLRIFAFATLESWRPSEALRDVSRRLLPLLTYKHTSSEELLSRMIPDALLQNLQNPATTGGDLVAPRPMVAVEGARDVFPRAAAAAPRPPVSGQPWSLSRVFSIVEQYATLASHKSSSASSAPISTPPPTTETVVYHRPHPFSRPALNWPLFYTEFDRDHRRPDLIWNSDMRRELADAIAGAIDVYTRDADETGGDAGQEKRLKTAWNHQEFFVPYESVGEMLKVGNYYLDILLASSEKPVVALPRQFFYELYIAFLRSLRAPDASGTQPATAQARATECLHGMRLLYDAYYDEIGVFGEISFLLELLAGADSSALRDALLLLLRSLVLSRLNATRLIFDEGNALKTLADLLPLAHLDRDSGMRRREDSLFAGAAITFQQGRSKGQHSGNEVNKNKEGKSDFNTKNEGEDDFEASQRIWMYRVRRGDAEGDDDKMHEEDEKEAGPVSLDTVIDLVKAGVITSSTVMWCTNNSLEPLAAKDIPAIKWGALNPSDRHIKKGLSLTDVTITVLDILYRLCSHFDSLKAQTKTVLRPIPRAKQLVSSPLLLPSLVQLLLTFSPPICARVHALLLLALTYNSSLSRLYLTGYFFFALMYPGSDLQALSSVLSLAHRHQSCAAGRSILSAFLPPALVAVLDNRGPEDFARTLLSDCETPEAIWGVEMRRALINRLSAHVTEISTALRAGDLAARYVYVPLAADAVVYPALRTELFCDRYYVRHFCDEQRYPQWPVPDPGIFLRACIDAWRAEHARRPQEDLERAMLSELQLKESDLHNLSDIDRKHVIRKAYLRLATICHPDRQIQRRGAARGGGGEADAEDASSIDSQARFERVQHAYEILMDNVNNNYSCNGAGRAWPDEQSISYLLRAQEILFRRFPSVLAEYKYSGYPILVEELQNAVKNGKQDLLRAATTLTAASARCCSGNADELARAAGVEALTAVLERTFPLVTAKATDSDAVAVISADCLVALAAVARIDHHLPQVASATIVAHCASRACALGATAPRLCAAGIETIKTLGRDAAALEDALNGFGVHWHLIALVLRFDSTLKTEEVGENCTEISKKEQSAPDCEKNMSAAGGSQIRQQHCNNLALDAAGTLVALCAGATHFQSAACSDNSTTNVIRKSSSSAADLTRLLNNIFTPFIVSKLKEAFNNHQPLESILSLICTESRSPLFVWSSAARLEALSIAEAQSTSWANPPLNWRVAATASGHESSIYKDMFNITPESEEKLRNGELVVSNLFVRVYLADPVVVVLPSPHELCVSLVREARRQLHGVDSEKGDMNQDVIALKEQNVLDNNSSDNVQYTFNKEGVESVGVILAAAAEVVERVLAFSSTPPPPQIAAGGIAILTHSLELTPINVNIAVVALRLLARLTALSSLLSINSLPIPVSAVRLAALALLRAPLASTKEEPNVQNDSEQSNVLITNTLLFVQRLTATSSGNTYLLFFGMHYLLVNILVSCHQAGPRALASACLARLVLDSAVGPKVRFLLIQHNLLPPAILDAVEAAPAERVGDATCALLDSSQRTPELWWDQQRKDRTRLLLEASAIEHQQFIEAAATTTEGEQIKPFELTEALFSRFPEEEVPGQRRIGGVYLQAYLAEPGFPLRRPRVFFYALLDDLLAAGPHPDPLVRDAVLELLRSNRQAADGASRSGYIPKLLHLPDALTLLTALVDVNAASADVLAPSGEELFRTLLQAESEASVEYLLLEKLFARPGISRSARNTFLHLAFIRKVPETLLERLRNCPDPTTRARMVCALKAIETAAGEMGNTGLLYTLSESSTWNQYKNQKMDLFIKPKSEQKRYITES